MATASLEEHRLIAFRLSRDVVKKRGHYVMEDWLHLAEAYTHVVAPDDLLAGVDPRLAEMWALLRAAVCHYARATAPDSVYPFTPAACDKAAENMWAYAVMVEKVRASHVSNYLHPARQACDQWYPIHQSTVAFRCARASSCGHTFPSVLHDAWWM